MVCDEVKRFMVWQKVMPASAGSLAPPFYFYLSKDKFRHNSQKSTLLNLSWQRIEIIIFLNYYFYHGGSNSSY
jgi:hypothetical protein